LHNFSKLGLVAFSKGAGCCIYNEIGLEPSGV
jgi:hypothetical protein